MSCQRECGFCGQPYSYDCGATLHVLRAKSGCLVIAGFEQPIHRCATLTKEDESMLLRDAAWIIENPDLGLQDPTDL